MWNYEKRLEFPVNIKRTDPKMAQLIITQYGGPDGELGASMRYLSQRFAMPYKNVCGVLTDIGTEELAHLEMICTIVHQLTRDLTPEQVKKSGFGAYYVDHTAGVWPQAASGVPFSAATFQSVGDPITDLSEDLAAEQKARAVYENLIDLTDDPNVIGPLLWLRQREIVHYARFKELFEYYDKKIKNGNNYINEPQKTNMNYNYNNDYLLYKLHTDNNSFF